MSDNVVKSEKFLHVLKYDDYDDEVKLIDSKFGDYNKWTYNVMHMGLYEIATYINPKLLSETKTSIIFFGKNSLNKLNSVKLIKELNIVDNLVIVNAAVADTKYIETLKELNEICNLVVLVSDEKVLDTYTNEASELDVIFVKE